MGRISDALYKGKNATLRRICAWSLDNSDTGVGVSLKTNARIKCQGQRSSTAFFLANPQSTRASCHPPRQAISESPPCCRPNKSYHIIVDHLAHWSTMAGGDVNKAPRNITQIFPKHWQQLLHQPVTLELPIGGKSGEGPLNVS